MYLVYTLWKYPDMLLSFTTWPLVLEKLSGGAGKTIFDVMRIAAMTRPHVVLQQLDAQEEGYPKGWLSGYLQGGAAQPPKA